MTPVITERKQDRYLQQGEEYGRPDWYKLTDVGIEICRETMARHKLKTHPLEPAYIFIDSARFEGRLLVKTYGADFFTVIQYKPFALIRHEEFQEKLQRRLAACIVALRAPNPLTGDFVGKVERFVSDLFKT